MLSAPQNADPYRVNICYIWYRDKLYINKFLPSSHEGVNEVTYVEEYEWFVDADAEEEQETAPLLRESLHKRALLGRI